MNKYVSILVLSFHTNKPEIIYSYAAFTPKRSTFVLLIRLHSRRKGAVAYLCKFRI